MRQQPFASPEEALAHYGVKGMRWGYRKKEETGDERTSTTAKSGERTSAGKVQSQAAPKASDLSERQQARVDKFMQRSDVMNQRIADLRRENAELAATPGFSSNYKQQINRDTIKQLETSKSKVVKDAEAVKKGKLTSTQKKLIVGGLVVGGVLAYAAVVRGQQSGALNSWELLARQRISGSKVPFEMNKELSKKMSAKDILEKVAKPVNPNYRSAGGQMNCRRSTYAYELRRRGYDVHATTSAVGWGQSESGVINAMTPGGDNFYRSLSVSSAVQRFGETRVARGDTRTRPVAKKVLEDLVGGPNSPYISSSKKVLDMLAKEPEGSRGEVLFRFGSFGHSMAYEVIDGKPHIFDSQKATLYGLSKRVESKWDGFHSAEITRLDNVDLDLKFLTRWADNN